jgi:hypothetical protein
MRDTNWDRGRGERLDSGWLKYLQVRSLTKIHQQFQSISITFAAPGFLKHVELLAA